MLIALAHKVEAELVVIDTFGKAVAGKENDADTVRDWYQWTGLRLKNAGRGFIRIDHAGKDFERGQRGTSAKNDDVDVVWRMTRLEGDRFRLVGDASGDCSGCPETVEMELVEVDNELGYRLLTGGRGYPAGTAEVADDLDRLGVPLEWGRIKAGKALRDGGLGRRNTTVSAALKYRRERLENLSRAGPGPVSAENRSRQKSGTATKPLRTPSPGQGGNRGARREGPGGCVSRRGHTWPPLGPEKPDPGAFG